MSTTIDKSTETQADKTPEQTGEKSVEKLELTQREIAIAQGKDPSEVGKEAVEDEEKESAESEPAGKEAAVTDGGSVETPAGKQTIGEEGGKDAPGSTESKTSWIDDDARSLAKSYQLSEDELQGFSSAAEFKKFASFMERQLAKPVGKTNEPDSKPAEGKTETKPEAKPGEKKKLDLDIEKYRKEGYDADTLAIVEFAKAQQEELESLKPVVEQMRRNFAEAEKVRKINAFHDAVDSLGDKRFGKSLDESGKNLPLSKSEDDARRKLFEASETILAGIVSRAKAAGTDPEFPSASILMRRAQHLAFGDELKADAKREADKKIADKIADQSKRRRPVGNSRPVVVPAPNGATPNEFAKSISDHPDVVNLWNKFQQANGSD